MIVLNTKISAKESGTYGQLKKARIEPTLFYINFFLTNFGLLFLGLFLFRLNQNDYNSQSFIFDNFRMYNVYMWLILNIFFFWTIKHLNVQHQTMFKLDYLIVIVNIFFFFTLLMVANNIYTFLMVLETCSYFFLYKLVLSKSFNTLNMPKGQFIKQYYTIIFYHY